MWLTRWLWLRFAEMIDTIAVLLGDSVDGDIRRGNE